MQLFLAFSLSTRLKCNSDVNADSLSIIQYALSRSLSLSLLIVPFVPSAAALLRKTLQGEKKRWHTFTAVFSLERLSFLQQRGDSGF